MMHPSTGIQGTRAAPSATLPPLPQLYSVGTTTLGGLLPTVGRSMPAMPHSYSEPTLNSAMSDMELMSILNRDDTEIVDFMGDSLHSISSNISEPLSNTSSIGVISNNSSPATAESLDNGIITLD